MVSEGKVSGTSGDAAPTLPAMTGREWRVVMLHAISSHVNRSGKLWSAEGRPTDPIAIQ